MSAYWKAKAHEVRAMAKIGAAYEAAGAVPERKTIAKLPGDPLALRGIPVTGRSIAGGAIRGTRPEIQIEWLDVGRA